MALVFVPVGKSSEPPKKPGFSWDAWYARNKARLSEKRARRYREDSAYRAKALLRSRQQRATTKSVVRDGYTVPFREAARQVGVTGWTLREWRRKNYFPEPRRRDGRLWFTPEQVGLLRELRQFFRQHGVRVKASTRDALGDVVALTYANWF